MSADYMVMYAPDKHIGRSCPRLHLDLNLDHLSQSPRPSLTRKACEVGTRTTAIAADPLSSANAIDYPIDHINIPTAAPI